MQHKDDLSFDLFDAQPADKQTPQKKGSTMTQTKNKAEAAAATEKDAPEAVKAAKTAPSKDIQDVENAAADMPEGSSEAESTDPSEAAQVADDTPPGPVNNLPVVPPAPQGDDDDIQLALYAEQAYLDYAISVVRGRALPELTDGQKPVQRRILYTMSEMGLKQGAKPVKSARVVGDVLGKFHPHGDSAAYDAMVRMAQDFTLRYPLIDGQGNFGSRDGDNAAAMRYTEARLTPIAQLLLDEIHEGTVDFVPNYDGTQKEPQWLPARLPMMLLNGASGIAVGMATEIPSHNLGEVAQACIAMIRNPKISHEEIMEIMPGPDFAGGSQVITAQNEVLEMYKTGKGALKTRARWVFEDRARGQWQLVVTELPPGSSSQKVMEEIEAITSPKPKAGKKSLTSEQQQAKAAMLALLDAVRDESGKDAPVRLVFEPKTSRVDRDEFVNHLLASTSMESNVQLNLVCLGLDGRPAQRGLREVLQHWIEFRKTTILRRTQHRLNKVLDRIHVLEGRLIVFLNIDEVIHLIRNSDEPKAELMERFSLSERQAEDILEIRLRQLSRMEGIKIEQELADKRAEQAVLEDLLANEKSLKKCMIQEIQADAKQYGDARRTLMKPAERASTDPGIVDEPITVVMSQLGWVRARQGHGHDPQGFSFKAQDSLYGTFECRTTHKLIVVGNQGRVYTVAANSLPSARGDGQPLTAMVDVEPGTRIAHAVAGEPKQRCLWVQDSGLGFICKLENMESRLKAGKAFIDVQEGAALLPPVLLKPTDTHVALRTQQERLLILDLKEIKTRASGGLGTILMNLDPKDKLIQAVAFGPAGLAAEGVYRNKEAQHPVDVAYYLGKRARKGKAFQCKIKVPTLVPLTGDATEAGKALEAQAAVVNEENTQLDL